MCQLALPLVPSFTHSSLPQEWSSGAAVGGALPGTAVGSGQPLVCPSSSLRTEAGSPAVTAPVRLIWGSRGAWSLFLACAMLSSRV